MLTKRIVCCLAIITCLPLVTWADNSLLLDKVVATVNQEIILHSELEEGCKQLRLEGKQVDETVKATLLRELVLNKIFLAKASSANIKVPEAYIRRDCDRTIAHMVRQIGSEEKLAQYFNQPIYSIKRELKRRLEEQYLALKVRQGITEHVVVTPAEVKHYFDVLPLHERKYYPAFFEVRQLVIYPKVALDRTVKATQQLLHLKQQLMDRRATFEALSKQYSHDTVSASKGGEIGWVTPGMLSPAYESAALALKVGEISDPIASEFGLHLIQLIDRKADQYNTRHILIMLQQTKEEIDLSKTIINEIREKIVAGGLGFDAAVKQYSEDKDTSLDGGLITVNNQGTESLPGATLSAEELDSEVYFAIDSLKEGDISCPQLINTQHKAGWRLLYLKQKVAPHAMSLTQDYEKIHHFLLRRKKNEAIHKWIQASKSAFVIGFDPAYKAVAALL